MARKLRTALSNGAGGEQLLASRGRRITGTTCSSTITGTRTNSTACSTSTTTTITGTACRTSSTKCTAANSSSSQGVNSHVHCCPSCSLLLTPQEQSKLPPAHCSLLSTAAHSSAARTPCRFSSSAETADSVPSVDNMRKGQQDQILQNKCARGTYGRGRGCGWLWLWSISATSSHAPF